MRHIRLIVLAGAAALALSGGGNAVAKSCGKHHTGGNPAVNEYVEKIPTTCGPKAARGNDTGTVPLPARVVRKLRGSSQGATLRKLASSRQLGAPVTKLRGADSSRASSRSALGAGVSAVTGGSNGRLIALLVVMALVAVVIAGAAAFRRRTTR